MRSLVCWTILIATLLAGVQARASATTPTARFAGVVGDRLVLFTHPRGAVKALAITGRPEPQTRIVGLDALPSGRVLGIDATGRVFDLDLATGRASMRFNARSVVSRSAFEGRSTFTIAPDGTSAIVASFRGAERIDLATGVSPPLEMLRYRAGDPLAAVATAPALDTLPNGELVGIESAGRGVVSGRFDSGIAMLGGLPVELHGPTRFTLDPSGKVGWLSTRAARRGLGCTRLVAVNPVTGATDLPAVVTLGGCIEALVALGPVDASAPVAPPSGTPAPRGAKPPPRFHTFVNLGLVGRQSARGIIRRGGLVLRPTSSGPALLRVTARLGGVVIARTRFIVEPLPPNSPSNLGPGPTRRLVRLIPGTARRLRAAAGRAAVSITVLLRDAGGRQDRRRDVQLTP